LHLVAKHTLIRKSHTHVLTLYYVQNTHRHVKARVSRQIEKVKRESEGIADIVHHMAQRQHSQGKDNS